MDSDGRLLITYHPPTLTELRCGACLLGLPGSPVGRLRPRKGVGPLCTQQCWPRLTCPLSRAKLKGPVPRQGPAGQEGQDRQHTATPTGPPGHRQLGQMF